MKISLKNIGKVREANVEIKGITTIAGLNNTGKSTVGKSLFSVFNSFYNLRNKIDDTRKDIILSEIKRAFEIEEIFFWDIDYPKITEIIIENKEKILRNEDELNLRLIKDILYNDVIYYFLEERVPKEELSKQLSNEMIENILKICKDILGVSDTEIFKGVCQKQMNIEFNSQISNLDSDELSNIILEIKRKNIKLDIKNHKIEKIDNLFSLNTEIIYYDSPFILDDVKKYLYEENSEHFNHNDLVKYHLVNRKTKNMVEEAINESIFNKKAISIMERLNKISQGELAILSDGEVIYRTEKEKPLNIENLSTGLKSFVILKTLLSKRYIKDNGILILDEPEVHLHPEWQLIFAELIVLIQKEFNLHILLNTHSIYFLRALEIFSVKHKISEKCKYYLAENEEELSIIKDVTDNIELIYEKLADPLQTLENLRCEDDED